MNVKGVGCDTDRNDPARGRHRWLAAISMAMDLHVPKNAETFF
jgi:hypothetical protein